MKIRTALSCNSGFYTLGNHLTFNKTSAFLHAVQPNFTSVRSLHVFMNSLRLVSYENANFGSNIFWRAEGELAKHVLEMSSLLEAQDLLPPVWWEKKQTNQTKAGAKIEEKIKGVKIEVQKLCKALD